MNRFLAFILQNSQSIISVYSKLLIFNHSYNGEGIVMEKKCAICKKTYTTFDAKSKYCSSACAKKGGKK